MIRYNNWTIDRTSLTITHGGYYYIFNGKQGNERKHIPLGASGRFMAAEHLVLSGGRANRQSLFEHIYGDDPGGGPLQGFKQVDVMLNHMQKYIFPKLGCYCVHTRRGGTMWYELKPFNAAQIAQKIIDVVRL